jgi:hypothetical protein
VYSELRLACILETLTQLERRIEESFPGSGLGRVASELSGLAREGGPAAERGARPIWYLRVGAALGIVGIVAVAVSLAKFIAGVSFRVDGVAELLQASEAAVNEVILLSLAIFFLLSLEARFKRSQALAGLHRLRSIVHVVDMHQLTKDPQNLLFPGAESPLKRTYTRQEIARYLDFCSELLSLASKLAALHVQYLNDPVVLDSVNDIETLAGGLSNKIWQKIMILDVMVPTGSSPCPAE